MRMGVRMRMRVCLANVFICMRRTSARKRVYMQMCPVIIEAALKCLLLLLFRPLDGHVWVLTICFCAQILCLGIQGRVRLSGHQHSQKN